MTLGETALSTRARGGIYRRGTGALAVSTLASPVLHQAPCQPMPPYAARHWVTQLEDPSQGWEMGPHPALAPTHMGLLPAPGDGPDPAPVPHRYHLAVTRHHENELTSSTIYTQNEPWEPPVSFESFLRNDENIENQVTPRGHGDGARRASQRGDWQHPPAPLRGWVLLCHVPR